MKKSLLIFYTYLFIVLEAVARAGYGGGGYRGRSYGGYSGYRSYGSRGTGGAPLTKGEMIAAYSFVIILLPLLYFLGRWYYTSKAKKLYQRAEELLKEAENGDSFWNEERLKKQVAKFF